MMTVISHLRVSLIYTDSYLESILREIGRYGVYNSAPKFITVAYGICKNFEFGTDFVSIHHYNS